MSETILHDFCGLPINVTRRSKGTSSKGTSSKRAKAVYPCLILWCVGLLFIVGLDAYTHTAWGRTKVREPLASKPLAASTQSSNQTVEAADSVGRAFFELRNAAMHNDHAKVHRNRQLLQKTIFAADADYYDLSLRLRNGDAIALKGEVQAFIAAHKKEFVAERMLQDWMRVLGTRQDDTQFMALYDPVRDGRNTELRCYQLLARLRGNEDVLLETRGLMSEFKKNQQGCISLFRALSARQKMPNAELWSWAQYFLEQNQIDEFLAMLSVLGLEAHQVKQLLSHPQNLLEQMIVNQAIANQAIGVLALTAYARAQPEKAQTWLSANYDRIPVAMQSQADAAMALRLSVTASADAHIWWKKINENTPLTQFQQEWRARAALHRRDWTAVLGAIAQMPESLRSMNSWLYWRAYALGILGQDSDVRQKLLEKVAQEQGFYPDLARLALDKTVSRTNSVSEPDVLALDQARFSNVLDRIQSLQAIGLYADMISEWSWLLRDLDEPNLLALARQSCERNMIDRCIAASLRTKKNIDWLQRYPVPFKKMVGAEARSVGVSLSFIYGIMRQESRFVASAHSSAGAMGLMQIMPQTAALVARQNQIPFNRKSVANPDVNIRLGTRYVKTLLDQFEGSWILVAAAYNAGPGRARKWQNSFEGSVEGAIFVETIPFNETRDYVKSVVHGAWVYDALLEQKTIPFNQVLGDIKPVGI